MRECKSTDDGSSAGWTGSGGGQPLGILATNTGGNDIFLTRYNSIGTQQWMRQIGTSSNDAGYGVAVDSSGNAYVTGWTQGAFTGFTSAGQRDIFLTKYNSSGTQQWMRQTGTSSNDWAKGVAVDSSGNAYVTGYTSGGSTGVHDIFLTKYDSSGTEQWMRQIGTSSGDYGYGVVADSSGNTYVTGYTLGVLAPIGKCTRSSGGK